MRRFWKVVAVVPAGSGFALALDGKGLKTPAGRDYLCPTLALVEVVVAEWRDAPEQFDPRRDMPLTQLVATTQDITAVKREEVIAQLAGYAAADLLCFRVAQPAALAALQQEVWQPYLDWAVERFDALLRHTTGLQPASQDPHALGALQKAMAVLDDYRLTALHSAASLSGSVVLGLALVLQWREANDVHHAAELDTHFQLAQWGEDEEARERLDSIKTELRQLEHFVGLLG